jgi:hypothetical protein
MSSFIFCTRNQTFFDQIKNDEIGVTRNTQGKMRNTFRNVIEDPDERYHLKDQCIKIGR